MAPGTLAGIEWDEVPLARRQKASTDLAERINHELVTDGFISQADWKTYKDGGDPPSTVVTPADLDGFYLGQTGLPRPAVKYAVEAARQNGIYLSHADPRDTLLKLLVGIALVVMVVATLEAISPIAFFHAYAQFQVVVVMWSVAMLFLGLSAFLEVTRGNRR